ncbi:hypothetical protein Bbelb_325280 [Branchiostoma belcheri]|nr:hypothetical protein Bbelb_325280 [Branchiostoma belcheri]
MSKPITTLPTNDKPRRVAPCCATQTRRYKRWALPGENSDNLRALSHLAARFRVCPFGVVLAPWRTGSGCCRGFTKHFLLDSCLLRVTPGEFTHRENHTPASGSSPRQRPRYHPLSGCERLGRGVPGAPELSPRPRRLVFTVPAVG